jgi:ubiquitin related modifier 1
MSTLNVKVEFGGGLELLFSNQRSHRVTIPADVPLSSKPADAENSTERKAADITYLMYWLRDNLLKEREELFIENGTVYVWDDICAQRRNLISIQPTRYSSPGERH